MTEFFLGGRRSPRDSRDIKVMTQLLPHSFPVRHSVSRRPARWNQLTIGSCEAHGCGRALATMYPGFMPSRLAMYFYARQREGTEDKDSGCYTRDMLKVMQSGVYSEDAWPYDISKFAVEPPETSRNATAQAIGKYLRVTEKQQIINATLLGDVLPFAINIPDYFPYVQGVMRMPLSRDNTLGEHCMAIVGYDMAFQSNPLAAECGLNLADVSNEMVEVDNSWGEEWGPIQGRVFIPMEWIFDPSNGDDVWNVLKPVAVTAEVDPSAPAVDGVKIDGIFVNEGNQ